MKKWLLSAILALCLVFTVCPVEASAYSYTGSLGSLVDEGSCGSNLKYQYYSNGVLFINGTGEMSQYWKRKLQTNATEATIPSAPWGLFAMSRSRLDWSFGGVVDKESDLYRKSWEAMHTIVIEEGVTSIGQYAFAYCYDVEEVILPSTLQSIGKEAFFYCFTDFVIPSGVTYIGEKAIMGKTTGTAGAYTTKPEVLAIGPEAARYVEELWVDDLYFYGTEEEWEKYKNNGYWYDKINPDTVYCESVFNPNAIGEYDKSTKTLIYSGTGSIQSFDFSFGPAKGKRGEVEHIVIEEGITGIGAHAFRGCTALKTVTMADTVTSIGSYAFYGCSNLTECELSANLENIEEEAFYECKSLKVCDLPETLKTIGSSAFKNCHALTIQEIPASVTEIGDVAFSNCDGLTEMTISVGTKNLGKQVFYDCDNLTKVTVDADIPEAAFKNCDALQTVTIENNVTSIGTEAFYNCDILQVVIPDSVTKIGEAAFVSCSGLQSATIGNGVKSIPATAFKNCTALTQLNIGSNVESIGKEAFSGCTSLVELVIPASMTSINDSAFSGCTTLKKITANCDFVFTAFRGSATLQEVVLGEGVVTLGANAFTGCSALTTVTLSKSVTEIGSAAFKNCDALTEMPGLGSVTTIAASVFEDCDSLTQITIPEGITEIGAKAFYGCDNLEKVVFPSTLRAIGEEAFADCPKLAAVEFSTGLAEIGKKAFANCDALPAMPLPAGLKTLGESAFYDCDGLTEIIAPGTLETIESQVFAGCDSLLKVTVEEGVKALGKSMFAGCKSLETVSMRDSLVEIGETAFQGCSSLSELKIPGSVTTIGTSAFKDCGGLQKVEIGYGMEVLSSNAFSGCTALYEVTLPNSIRRIEKDAFKGCTALKTVKAEGDVPTYPSDLDTDVLQANAFSGCSALETVAVPAGIVKLADEAFSQRYSLVSVSVNEKLVSIGAKAFYKCGNLLSVKGSTGVESIGANAFYECPVLTRVDSGTALKYIGDYAFYQCSGLTKFNFGSLENLGKEAFYECESLQKVEIPDSARKIPDKAFYGCINLNTLTVGNGVTEIGNCAFEDCKRMAKAKLGDGVTTIGAFAFRDCAALTNLDIGSSLQNVGEYAFVNCNALNKVNTNDLANWCSINFYYSYDNPVMYAKCLYVNDELLTDMIVPDEVTEIGSIAFFNCNSLKTVTFSNNTTQIQFGAFASCENLRVLSIPESVEIVREAAFSNCTSLETVNYAGTQEKWEDNVSIGPENDPLNNAKFNYNAANTHKHSHAKTEVVPATCTDKGYTIYKCDCGDEYRGDETELAPHWWNDGEVTKEATEETEGEMMRTCEICGATETEPIPKLEHKHSHAKTEVVPATCTEKGYTIYKCDCGDEYRGDETELADHTWNAGEVTKEATEEAEGEMKFTCDVCGQTETRPIPKLDSSTDGAQKTPGEVWEYDNDGSGKNDDLASAETITADQSYRGRVGKGDFADCYQISTDGKELEFAVTLWSTTMHILENRGLEIQFYDAQGQIVTPDKSNILTRELEGIQRYDFLYTYQFAASSPVRYVKFSVENAEKGNGYSFKAALSGEAPHVHSYKKTITDPTCVEEGYTTYTCDCGDTKVEDKVPALDHKWDDGVVTKEATEENDGEMLFTCIRCPETKTEVISKQEHSHSYKKTITDPTCMEEGYTTYTCDCGDTKVEDKVPALDHMFFDGICIVCGDKDPAYVTPTEPTEPEPEDPDVGIVDSGDCGELHWTLDSQGVLTISGAGAMPYCQMESEVPWSGYCEQITKAVIQEGVTSVGPYAFYNCLNLEEVDIADSVIQIHQSAFYRCRSLKSVVVPDKVVSIGNEAFYSCDSLQSIELGTGVQLLGRNVFDMCRSLTEITIPESVVSIDSYCFQSCESLGEITFLGNAPAFGGNVFSGVGIFPSDTATCLYPEGNDTWTDSVMQNMGGRLVWKAYGKQEEEVPGIGGVCGSDMQWELDETTGTLIISGSGYMNNVESMIYSPWYAYRDKIRTVVIEEGVISVGDNMLSGLYALTEVMFPKSLRFVGEGAFSMDTSLPQIDLSGLETIHGEAFSGCASLEEVTLPANVNIGHQLFRDCTGLKKVTICANSREALGHGSEMFRGCTALTEVILEAGVGSIPQYAFADCTALEKITIPSSVEVIAANAFQDCTALREVTLESGVGEIGASAFRGCLGLTSFTFPAVVGPVNEAVFNYCENLDTIRFEGDAPEISGSAFSTLKVTAYYPSGNKTWNKDTLRYYGSTLIDWIPYGHAHSYTAQTVAPSCSGEGYTVYTCACGDSYIGDRVPALEHRYSEGKCSVCGEADPDYVPPVEPELSENVTRLAGLSRYETSFAIANEMKEVLGVEKFDSIILASSEGFADALAGSYLAAVKQAPIIIGKEKYKGIVCDYVNANLAENGTVYVLGGEGAVPEAMLSGITVTKNFQRLAGNDRYTTNLAILAKAGVAGKDILVATGQDFADSLSASATGLPILLVNGKPGKTLSDAQKDFLADVTGNIYIIGGESAVPASMVEQIEAASGKKTERIAGGSRYETSIEIAKAFLADAESAVVAYASTFPDGLCGGPLAYAVKAPLILTKDGKSEAPGYTKANGITSGYVLGGDGLISDGFAKQIFQITEIVK